MADDVKKEEQQQEEKEVKSVTKKEDISTQVLGRLKDLETTQGLTYPVGYNPANELKAFQLELTNIKDKDGKPAVEVCTVASIANAMLNMVQQGLRISTKQCYAIVYGDQLTLMRSYFGSESVAKKVCAYLDPKPWHPVIVYEGEDFEFVSDIDNGGYKVVRHIPNLDAIDKGIIKCVYLTVKDITNKTLYTEIMTWKQVQKSWAQSKNSGNNKFQSNFPDQAAIRSIIGRVAKRYINTAEIKDERLAQAISETVDEFSPSNNIEEQMSYSEEEMNERNGYLELLKQHDFTEEIICTYYKVSNISLVPTEILKEKVQVVCANANNDSN